GRLAGHDRRAALAALDQPFVGAEVELAPLELAGVADSAALEEDRFDLLVVDDRVLAVQLDHLDRFHFGLLLLLRERRQRCQREQANSQQGAHAGISLNSCQLSEKTARPY